MPVAAVTLHLYAAAAVASAATMLVIAVDGSVRRRSHAIPSRLVDRGDCGGARIRLFGPTGI